MLNIRVRVYHSNYGCETGCCGHIVELSMPDGSLQKNFEFEHPCGQEIAIWAHKFAENVVRSEWPTCFDSIDWDTLVVEANDSC
jgi:hypothetical protein